MSNNRLYELVDQATHNVLGVKQLDSVILAELIINECTELLCAHSASLEAHHFQDKANTARACAGILREHFGLE